MTINELLSDDDPNEESVICALDKILLCAPTDAEIEAVMSMPIDEVDAELMRIGMDPNAPLPEWIVRLIHKKEFPKEFPSSAKRRLRAPKRTSARPRLFWPNPFAQIGRLTGSLSWSSVAVLFGVICFATYGLLDRWSEMLDCILKEQNPSISNEYIPYRERNPQLAAELYNLAPVRANDSIHSGHMGNHDPETDGNPREKKTDDPEGARNRRWRARTGAVQIKNRNAGMDKRSVTASGNTNTGGGACAKNHAGESHSGAEPNRNSPQQHGSA